MIGVYDVVLSNAFGSETSDAVMLSVPSSVAPNLDGDCDVDSGDLVLLRVCMSGSGVPLALGCEGRDFDADGDADMNSFGIFHRCYRGSGVAADPDCAD